MMMRRKGIKLKNREGQIKKEKEKVSYLHQNISTNPK